MNDSVSDENGKRVRRIAAEVSQRLPQMDAEVFAFGYSQNDIDIAVVISDSSSPLFVIETLSTPLLDISIREDVLVTCTPIHRSDFDRADNAFVRNVKENRI